MVNPTCQHPTRHQEKAVADDAIDDAQEMTPFRIVNRGEDTTDAHGNVQFADFSPRVLPADVPDEAVEVPKEESAQAPVPSSESTEIVEPKRSETTVQAPVVEDDGMPSPNGSGKRASSSEKKTG